MSPAPVSIRLDVLDAEYQLTAAERATIQPSFDADALERLLARIQPGMRREILAYFQIPTGGRRLGHLTQFHDPELQALLEEVWAPVWANATDQQIEENLYGLPGRGVAKERRARTRERNDGQP